MGIVASESTDKDQITFREPDIIRGNESPPTTVLTLLGWDNPDGSVMPMDQMA